MSSPEREQLADPRPVEFHQLGLASGELTDYHQAWARQRELHALVASGELGPQVLYVEHARVYTAGRSTLPAERPQDGTPVVDVDRGGKITYHGPGQLVGYPIVFLPRGIGVVDYVRRLEEALIRMLAGYGLTTGRVAGRTGVWLAAGKGRGERKIAAIGVRVSHQTTMHGFALNVTSDLADFDKIIPCGIADAEVTSLERELGGRPVPSLAQVASDLMPFLAEMLAFGPVALTPNPPGQPGVGSPTSVPQVKYGLAL